MPSSREINLAAFDRGADRYRLSWEDILADADLRHSTRYIEVDDDGEGTFLDNEAIELLPTSVAAQPETETVTENPYRPRIGDLVTYQGESTPLVTTGEAMLIEEVDTWFRSCNRCSGCVSLHVIHRRLSSFRETHTFSDNYMRVSACIVAPLPPQSGAQRVRCALSGQGHSPNGHQHRDDCVNPVRMPVDFVRDIDSHNGLVMADALSERERQREAHFASIMPRLRPGQEYTLDSTSQWYGYVVSITRVEPNGQHVIADIGDGNGSIYRTRQRLSVLELGTRVGSWQSQNVPPRFISFTQREYAGSVPTVTDREVTDVIDDHECDDDCFDRGCRSIGAAIPALPDPVRVPRYDDEGCENRNCGTCFRDEDDDRTYNEDEDEDEREYIGDLQLMPYSYRPHLIFSGDGPVYLGTELELSCGNDYQASRRAAAAAKLLSDALGDKVLFKGDGSISGIGFEAVFHPMSYDWIIDNFPTGLMGEMRRAGAMPHSSCGMHVHVNRNGFSDPVHAYKWIKFMYRNAPQMERLARRDPSTWGSFSGRSSERAAAKWHAKGGYGAQNRYTAINCCPPHTYEVRIFASTLNRNRFLGSLGLVDSSIEYTRQLKTPDILHGDGWTFEPFREYVHSFTKYKPLQAEMARLLDN